MLLLSAVGVGWDGVGTPSDVRHDLDIDVRQASIRTTTAATAAIYPFGSLGSNACPTGSSAVSTASDCQAAAAGLGLTWKGTEEASDGPKSCYETASGNAVYFNVHSTGGGKASARPICEAACV